MYHAVKNVRLPSDYCTTKSTVGLILLQNNPMVIEHFSLINEQEWHFSFSLAIQIKVMFELRFLLIIV